MNNIINTNLGSIGKVCMCKRIMKEQTSPVGDIPFYKISTFGGKPDVFISRELFENYKTNYNYPKKGDILVSAAGTLGRTVIFDGKDSFFQDSNIVWIKNDESKVLNDYLYYFYKIIHWKKTSGSTIERLYNENIEGAEIFYPEDLNDQIKVVKILKFLDSKIETNNKINAELESMAKTLYDYWFLQFEFPNEEGKPYKSSGGKMVYNEELKREIPVGWEVKELLDEITWKSNSQPPKNEFVYEPKNGYIRFIQNRDYDGETHLTYIPYKESLEKVNRLDILIDKYGDAGATRYGLEGVFNVALGKLDVNKNYMREYIRSFVSSKPIYDYLHNSCMASTRASLSEDNLEGIKLIIPPKYVLDKYETQLNIIRNKILKSNDENQELSSLRDFLLPLLMNGQVTIQ